MLEKSPLPDEMNALIGSDLFKLWTELCALIESRYDTERIWNTGGKRWVYEYKYRRGGKTLCALYAKQNVFGFMLIFGRSEREKFEASREYFSTFVQTIYDEAITYHDGKWMMFELSDDSSFSEIEQLLLIKRRPNKK